MTKNQSKRTSSKKSSGSYDRQTSSPAVGNGSNDRVAKGSNPRFSSSNGVGRLSGSSAVSSKTKAAASKVAAKSGVKTRHTATPAKRVNKRVRPTRQTYPSKRVLAIMDPEERARYN